MSMAEARPAGISLLSGALALLGVSAVGTNATAIILELGRVPRWVECYGLLYGFVALVAATLLIRMSRHSRAAFAAWATLALGVFPILWPHLDAPLLLIPAIIFLLALFYVGQRYVGRITSWPAL